MADNLTLSIGIDTAKMRADLEIVKTQFRDATQQMKKMSEEAARTGDRTGLDQAAKAVDALKREMIPLSRALREQEIALAGVGRSAHGAAGGLHAAARANLENAEASKVNVREIAKVSKELGGLEVSGFGVAKMFKEFPKVAVPAAVAAGVLEGARKLSNAAYMNITALDDLSKASGFASESIVALRHQWEAADVPAVTLDKTLQSMGESFDKARIKAGDFGSMVSGVQTFRGGGGAAAGSGVSLLRGGGPATGDLEGQGQTVVLRGGTEFKMDPSKGFAGLVDPNQFKTVEEWFAAVRRSLENLNKMSPLLAREVIRGQGLDPVATLRGMGYRGDFEGIAGDPLLQAGRTELARRYGAATEQLSGLKEGALTEAGIGPMEGATRDIQTVNEGIKTAIDSMREMRTTTYGWIDDLKKADFTTGAAAWADAWHTQIDDVTKRYDDMVSHMNSTASSPRGEGTVPPAESAAPVSPLGSGFAVGGVVPGMGSGDTVRAWLTPGEFVNRRASVDYYGSSLFRALNSRALPREMFSRYGFAAGGLVGDPHFADGGLVAATSSGTPVHLHLDGKQFAMTATESVATALIGAARNQQMKSAGIKPTWVS